MTLSPAALVLNVQDARRAAEFWTQALGYRPQPDAPDFLVSPDGSGVRIHLDEDDRTHLDLWVDSTSDQEVLADTEGNLFCVIA
jgi:catechol 2,3-dioxygenase-like lactoylglutathione lyase family enzyme